MATCPFCNQTIDDDGYYCEYCGKKLYICPQCFPTTHKYGKGEGKRCGNCGAPLVPADPQDRGNTGGSTLDAPSQPLSAAATAAATAATATAAAAAVATATAAATTAAAAADTATAAAITAAAVLLRHCALGTLIPFYAHIPLLSGYEHTTHAHRLRDYWKRAGQLYRAALHLYLYLQHPRPIQPDTLGLDPSPTLDRGMAPKSMASPAPPHRISPSETSCASPIFIIS